MSDATPGQLKQHHISLSGQTDRGLVVKLRPLTENDWSLLEKWNRDPDVRYYADGDAVAAYSPEKVRQIYRSVSQHAYSFLIEADGQAIGECWLQQMNLPRVLPGANSPFDFLNSIILGSDWSVMISRFTIICSGVSFFIFVSVQEILAGQLLSNIHN
jgi:hypothetical protein